jgi:hypothetical protein
VITLSTRIYGLRMNPRSATCGRNHETWRSEAQPLWSTFEYFRWSWLVGGGMSVSGCLRLGGLGYLEVLWIPCRLLP